jgi:hypothetical protein
VAVLVGVATLLVGNTAFATGDLTGFVQVVEIAVPDLHLELRDDGRLPLVLAWPMHAGIDWGALARSQYLTLTIFLEPAVVPIRGEARLSLGSRVGLRLGGDDDELSPGLFFEAGALTATDGQGGFVGAGVGGIIVSNKATLGGLNYRYVMTTEAPRHDFGLDLVTWPF